MNKLLLASCLLLCWPLSAAQHPSFTTEDMYLLQDLSEPELSADGQWLLYSVNSAVRDTDSFQADLYLVPFAGGPAKALTSTAEHSEYAAQWSSDGKSFVYLSDATKNEEVQVFWRTLDGSSVKQLTDIAGGVSDYSWSADGSKLAFIAEDRLQPDPKAKHPLPIEVERFQFKEDGRGYLTTRQHLYLLDIASNTQKLLTPGAHDDYLPQWSPDGRWIAFVSKRAANADRNINFDVFIVSADGKELKQISQFSGTDVDPYWESKPAWSADSKQLVWLRSGDDKWLYYTPWQLVVANIETGQQWQPAWIDRSFYQPRFGADGAIYTLVEQDRSTYLAKVDVQSGALSYLTSGRVFAYDFTLAKDKLVVLESTDNEPFRLRTVEKTPRVLTRHNEFLQQRQLASTEHFDFKSKDGTPIQAFLVKPAGAEAGKPLPLIVRLHGGPVYQFSHEFMWDWQVYAAAGFAVLAINPRGSSGRGFDFAKAIYADWGNKDVADVLAGVDALIATGQVDSERIAIGGWSYGSILTNYVIASDSRFKAAVSGAGNSSPLSSYGHDQYSREYELELGTPWANTETYLKLSYPLLKADRIKTPTLFQCAAEDLNVPCLGAEQMYQALSSQGLPSKLVVYPEQNHGLSVPSYLQHRMIQNLNWYQRFTGVKQ